MTPKEIEDTSLRFDTVVDCSGSARAFEMAVKSSDRGATILVFGCAPKDAVARYLLDECALINSRIELISNFPIPPLLTISA